MNTCVNTQILLAKCLPETSTSTPKLNAVPKPPAHILFTPLCTSWPPLPPTPPPSVLERSKAARRLPEPICKPSDYSHSWTKAKRRAMRAPVKRLDIKTCSSLFARFFLHVQNGDLAYFVGHSLTGPRAVTLKEQM